MLKWQITPLPVNLPNDAFAIPNAQHPTRDHTQAQNPQETPGKNLF